MVTFENIITNLLRVTASGFTSWKAVLAQKGSLYKQCSTHIVT